MTEKTTKIADYLKERGLAAYRALDPKHGEFVVIKHGEKEIGRYYNYEVTKRGLATMVTYEEVFEKWVKPIVEAWEKSKTS